MTDEPKYTLVEAPSVYTVGFLGAEVMVPRGSDFNIQAANEARLAEIERRILRIEAFLGPLP